MPRGKKKTDGLKFDLSHLPKIDWDAINTQVKQFDSEHFSKGDIDLTQYNFSTDIVTSLDDYYKDIASFLAETTQLLLSLQDVIYTKDVTGRNNLLQIQNLLAERVKEGKGKFKTFLEKDPDIFRCRFIQQTISEINKTDYLTAYLEQIEEIEPNKLYGYNTDIVVAIKNIWKLQTNISRPLLEYVSEKFDHLIIGDIPFFNDLKLLPECEKLLRTEKIVTKLEAINKEIIETGKLSTLNDHPEETLNDFPINFDTAAAKYLTLREMGIIEDILSKFVQNKTKAAQYIASITNEKATTIKPFLSYAPGSNPRHNPETEPALNNAIAILNQLGLTNEVANLQKILLDKERKKETKKGNTPTK